MKIALAASFLLLPGCLMAPPSGTDGLAGQTSEAMASAREASVQDAGSSDKNEPFDELPRWRTFLIGKDASEFPVEVRHPGNLDSYGLVVAIREGDEHNEERWVRLRLADHWRLGGTYFEDLIRTRLVTVVDLIVIDADLLQHGNELPVLQKGEAPPPPAMRPMLGLEDRGGDWHPFPGAPGSDHTGGPVLPQKPGGLPPGVGQPGPSSHGAGGKWSPPVPAKPWVSDWDRDGKPTIGPAPPPSPYEKGYVVVPGEPLETFMCEGVKYTGHHRACPDYQRTPSGMKWATKLLQWFDRFSPNKVTISPTDRERICRAALLVSSVGSCGAATAACAAAEVVTVGGATIACGWVYFWLCGVHGAVTSYLNCTELVNG